MKNATEYVKEGLEKDSPVAILNYYNPDLEKVPYTDYKGDERESRFNWHWVTITAIEENVDTGEVTVEVSSWGSRARLDLNNVISSFGFRGMIYFDVK